MTRLSLRAWGQVFTLAFCLKTSSSPGSRSNVAGSRVRGYLSDDLGDDFFERCLITLRKLAECFDDERLFAASGTGSQVRRYCVVKEGKTAAAAMMS